MQRRLQYKWSCLQTREKSARNKCNWKRYLGPLEVLKLIVDGKSNKEIARLLDVTDHTAKAHVGSIIQKLSVDDRTQVAVKALREGWV
jgi:DNA-binding CsgD family transcriptional regulator